MARPQNGGDHDRPILTHHDRHARGAATRLPAVDAGGRRRRRPRHRRRNRRAPRPPRPGTHRRGAAASHGRRPRERQLPRARAGDRRGAGAGVRRDGAADPGRHRSAGGHGALRR
ncbi:hypothetical protein E3T33_03840 [Cryobacterium sp. TMT1-2-1]|nr:hypothetical protein E3T33_03840 [Cryobacterium sp. TMT1-2-1]